MRKRKVFIPVLISLVVLIGVGFYAYIQKYQEIINEGSQLLDQHCIAINPLIIERKTAYIGSMKAVMAKDVDGYMSAQYSWLGSAKEYLALEKLWLGNQKTFMERSDVRFFLSADIQEAAEWQYKMYRAEYEGTDAVVQMFKERRDIRLQDLNTIVTRTSNESKIAQQAYDLKWGENMQKKTSFRDQFVTLPQVQCPEENNHFPDVEKELGL